MKVKFYGTRGSIPVTESEYQVYGGNTSCVAVCYKGGIGIFDAGTGIRNLGIDLFERKTEKFENIFLAFSHFHWDHIQGFPFFAPAFVKGNRFDLFGAHKLTATLSETLAGQMSYPNFPVSLTEMAAQMNFHDLREGETVACGDAVITNAQLFHPDGVFGYRVEFGGHAVVVATDTEHYAVPDQKLLNLAEGADVLIYDAMYTPEEYAGGADSSARTGWGHSTWAEGVKVAREAGVRQLVLFHHDPNHDDGMIDHIEATAQAQFGETTAAREGTTITVA